MALASRAPSLHNTQPWRWQLHEGVLDLRADRSRQLRVADPDGHSLLISCGAAAELTQLPSLLRVGPSKRRCFPTPRPRSAGALPLAPRAEPIRRRRSERRPRAGGAASAACSGHEPVSPEEIERLRDAAQAPAMYAHFPSRPEESLELAVAISRADRSERDDPAYAAEMAQWVRDDPDRPDGVPTSVIPAVPVDQPRHTDIPLRDFELGIPGAQLITHR